MKTWLRIIAGLEVAGGLSGIGLITWQVLIATETIHAPLAAVIAFGVYILSIVAGITLWQEQPFGRKTSIIIQMIQLPKFLSVPLTFFFSFGFDLYIYLVSIAEFSNLRINLKLGAYHQLYINLPNAPFGIGVSIPACIFLAKLLSYKLPATVDRKILRS
jgi:hypothetical protein